MELIMLWIIIWVFTLTHIKISRIEKKIDSIHSWVSELEDDIFDVENLVDDVLRIVKPNKATWPENKTGQWMSADEIIIDEEPVLEFLQDEYVEEKKPSLEDINSALKDKELSPIKIMTNSISNEEALIRIAKRSISNSLIRLAQHWNQAWIADKIWVSSMTISNLKLWTLTQLKSLNNHLDSLLKLEDLIDLEKTLNTK